MTTHNRSLVVRSLVKLGRLGEAQPPLGSIGPMPKDTENRGPTAIGAYSRAEIANAPTGYTPACSGAVSDAHRLEVA